MREQGPTNVPEPVRRAVSELTGLIHQHFPTATFQVRRGVEDPEETFITTTVDIEDPDEVLEPIMDRMLALQLDEEVPVYVVPVHTPERIAETQRRIATHLQRRDTEALPLTGPR